MDLIILLIAARGAFNGGFAENKYELGMKSMLFQNDPHSIKYTYLSIIDGYPTRLLQGASASIFITSRG